MNSSIQYFKTNTRYDKKAEQKRPLKARATNHGSAQGSSGEKAFVPSSQLTSTYSPHIQADHRLFKRGGGHQNKRTFHPRQNASAIDCDCLDRSTYREKN